MDKTLKDYLEEANAETATALDAWESGDHSASEVDRMVNRAKAALERATVLLSIHKGD